MFYYYKNNFDEIPEVIIQNFIDNHQEEKFIYFVPTKRAVLNLTKELISKSKNKSSSGLNIFNFETFCEGLYQTIFPIKKPIPDSIMFVLLKDLIENNKLKFFNVEKEFITTGLVELFCNIISKLKELGIDPQQFKKTSENYLGNNKNKSDDIFLIYSKYQKRTEQLNFFDTGDVYRYLSQLTNSEFSNAFRKSFPDVEVVYFMGFSEFSPPEYEIIRKLMNLNNCQLYISLNYYPENPDLFGNISEIHKKFIDIGFKYSEFKLRSDELEKILSENLFNKNKSKIYNSDKFFIVESQNIRHQIEKTAQALIKNILNVKNFDISKCCILVNNLSEVSDLFREVFSEYEIPVNITDRFHLNASTTAVSIINFLKTINNNYKYSELFGLLDSVFFQFDGIDKNAVKNVIVDENLTEGRNNYLKIIEKKINRYEKESSLNPENEYFIEKLSEYKSAFKSLKIIFQTTVKFEKKNKIENFVNNLRDLVRKTDVASFLFSELNLVDFSDELLIINKEVKALNSLLEVLDELIDFHTLIGEEEKEFGLDYFIDFLSNSISGVRYNISPKLSKGVLVTTPNEIRGLKFKEIYLLNMNNGIFPRKYTPLMYFEDKFSDEESIHLLKERYLFFETLNSCTDKLYFFFSKEDNKKPLSKSDFIKEIEQLFYITVAEKELTGKEIDILSAKTKVDEKKLEIRLNNINKRKSIKELSEFTGLISDYNLLEILRKNFNESSHSATELQDYLNCPFKYFSDHILNLSELGEIEEEITQRNIGELLHIILKKFFDRIKSTGKQFKQMLENEFDLLKEILIETTSEVINDYTEDSPYKFLLEHFFFGQNDFIFERFLESEKTYHYITPYKFEERFDVKLDFNDGKSIKLKGKIDRVDLDKNGLRITDYKTGKAEFQSKNALNIQLPLYLMAYTKVLEENGALPENKNALYIKFARDEIKSNVKYFSLTDYLKVDESDSRKAIAEFLDNTKDTLSKNIDDLMNGKFNIMENPDKNFGLCKYCVYQLVCRAHNK